MGIVYLNNAATSYPKPRPVVEAVQRSLLEPPVEPGRAGGEGDDSLHRCRHELAQLLGVARPEQVVLLPSATHAVNLVLWGMLVALDGAGSGGRHVVSTVLEHNAVLRPLTHMERSWGIDTTWVAPDDHGVLTTDQVAAALQPQTQLVVISHAANVSGTVQPVAEIAAVAAERGVALLIDAAQSAGAIPIDYEQLPGRVFVAFAGHKGLLGPAGVGGLIVPDEHLPQTIVGGTGIRSESLRHPPELPLRHEAGTPNLAGLAGLAAGVAFMRERGVAHEGRHRHRLVLACREQLHRIPGLHLLPLGGDDGRAGIVSFTLAGFSCEELAFVLRQSFAVETRAGLHCAPLCHRFFDTAPHGTLRVSFGTFNGPDEVEHLAAALADLVRR